MKFLQIFKSNFKYIVVIALTIIVMSVFKCSHSEPVQIDPLKTKIQAEVKAGDSLKKIAVKSDSVRIEYVIKWRKLKADTVKIPCDSLLKKLVHICDTIVTVDSTEIANLKKVIVNDSLIISDCFKVIKNDSLAIIGLNKTLRRQKFKNKLVVIGLGGLLGYSAFRK